MPLMINGNSLGHTLVELLIAMMLALLIIAAIIPVNSLGLKTTEHQGKTIQTVNQLRQSLIQIESDIKSVASTGCLLNKNYIRDLIFTQPLSIKNQLSHPWLAGNQTGNWYPQTPFFTNSNISNENDALHLMFAVLNDQLDLSDLNSPTARVFYITNCLIAEAARGVNSSLATITDSQIYPLQSIIYYVREVDEKPILYRQYLSKTGNTRNEPLVDNIESLKIGYAEQTDTETVIFKSANEISDWTKIVAIYLQLKIDIEGNSYSVSKLVAPTNLYE